MYEVLKDLVLGLVVGLVLLLSELGGTPLMFCYCFVFSLMDGDLNLTVWPREEKNKSQSNLPSLPPCNFLCK